MDEKHYTDLAIQITKVDSRSKSNEIRISEHEDEIKELVKKQDAIYTLASSVESIAKDMTYIKEDVQEVKSGQKEMSNKITTLENRPANEVKKKLDVVYEKIIWVILGGITIYLLSQILPVIKW